MKERFKIAYMRAAEVYAQLSHAKRRQVGCVVVKDDTIIAIGYNGTPPGWDNSCEGPDGLTLPHVIHAEQNAMDKLMRGSTSSTGAAVFVTTAPCFPCAMRLRGAGVTSVYYRDAYHNTDGIDFLAQAGIYVEQVDIQKE